MTDRCRCFSIFSRDSWCSVHGDVDAILASGRYTDRRGRVWMRNLVDWWHVPSDRALTRDQVRTLIERDLHRDECPGLRDCDDHPVPHVVIWLEGPTAHDTRADTEAQRDTLAGAITAARRMTGGTL